MFREQPGMCEFEDFIIFLSNSVYLSGKRFEWDFADVSETFLISSF